LVLTPNFQGGNARFAAPSDAHAIIDYISVSQSGRNRPLVVILMGKGAKKVKGRQGAKQHKGGESAQPY